jgi:hypothetical protein
VSWPDEAPADDLHKIADAIWKSRPWWVVWWGEHTRRFWAIAAWMHGPVSVIAERTPDALLATMHNFETIFPKPDGDQQTRQPGVGNSDRSARSQP